MTTFMNRDKLEVGNVLSETTHYKVVAKFGDHIDCILQESGDKVSLGNDYALKYCSSGDVYEEIKEVTKEDKADGTPGIRSIFENVHSSEVFTVVFKKQDKKKTKKQIAEEKNSQINEAIAMINRAKEQKKSMAVAYAEALQFIQNNPVQDYIEGESRTLRGYKVQFQSRDGRYDCVDMDIERTDTESGIRPVNINTIESLIYKGVKYVVK